MIDKKLIIQNRRGIHCRPSGEIAKIANTFLANITITKISTQEIANAKNLMDLLSLGLFQYDEVILSVEGQDEKKIHSIIEEVIIRKFDFL